MNWYKKAQNKLEQNPYYMDIGHPLEQPETDSQMFLWISDLAGGNFHMEEADGEYDHTALAYDVGLNQQIGTIQGRYDSNKDIVSVNIDPSIANMRELPNRLMNRLYKEFGNNITIIDYSSYPPKRLI